MKLEDIRKLCDAAKPEPWDYDGRFTVSVPGDWAATQSFFRIAPADAAFIAASRTLMPKLLAVAEAVEKARHMIYQHLGPYQVEIFDALADVVTTP